MRKAWLVVVGLLGVAAAAKGERWNAFSAYPRARPLCDEHVAANRAEIAWRSFATRDPVTKVLAFYRKDQRAKLEKDATGGFTMHAPTDEASVLSIYSAELADKYPSCDSKPKAGERTVILVSKLMH